MAIASKMYVYNHDEVIGYETGPSLLQQLALTTLVPKYRYIATNRFKQNGSRVIEDLGLVIRKPRTTVDHENYKYLQVREEEIRAGGIPAHLPICNFDSTAKT